MARGPTARSMRGSTAAPMITNTSVNVPMNSASIPSPSLPSRRGLMAGAPKLTSSALGKSFSSSFTISAAATAPASWATM